MSIFDFFIILLGKLITFLKINLTSKTFTASIYKVLKFEYTSDSIKF